MLGRPALGIFGRTVPETAPGPLCGVCLLDWVWSSSRVLVSISTGHEESDPLDVRASRRHSQRGNTRIVFGRFGQAEDSPRMLVSCGQSFFTRCHFSDSGQFFAVEPLETRETLVDVSVCRNGESLMASLYIPESRRILGFRGCVV